jgi:thiamine-phosphate pyrophosphorylase
LPPGRKPILCYVTDRRAFDGALASSRQFPDSRANALCEIIRDVSVAGADWIQIREKDLAGRALAELARHAVAAISETGARIFVNDRLDVALASGAAGIHLGETSLPVEAVTEWRQSSGRTDFQIGISCHSLETARAAERGGANYIFFGPVFATPSKAAFGAPQGVEILRAVCNSVGIPVLAIGGVTLENAASCIAAGAAGIAAIRLFQQGGNVAGRIAKLREV